MADAASPKKRGRPAKSKDEHKDKEVSFYQMSLKLDDVNN